MRAAIVSALLLLLVTGCKEVLYDSLSQREANKLVTTLRQSGIHAERVKEGDGTFSVLVAKDAFAESVRLLEQRGLPRQRFDTMADVFTSDNLLSTPLEERARLAYALSQELTGSLTAVDGILDAHVHLTLSKDLPLSDEQTPATASVLINHAPGFGIEAIVPDIKFLVAKGVPNLNYRDVSVVTVPETNWDPVPDRSTGAFESFLGIRFAKQDLPRFAILIASLSMILALFLCVIGLVFWQRGLLPKLNGGWLGALSSHLPRIGNLGNLVPRWIRERAARS